jgi:hypothetical protein
MCPVEDDTGRGAAGGDATTGQPVAPLADGAVPVLNAVEASPERDESGLIVDEDEPVRL